MTRTTVGNGGALIASPAASRAASSARPPSPSPSLGPSLSDWRLHPQSTAAARRPAAIFSKVLLSLLMTHAGDPGWASRSGRRPRTSRTIGCSCPKSMGLTRWWSKPASRERRRSSSRPYPVSATSAARCVAGGAQPRRDRVAVHPRQPDVEQHQVRRRGGRPRPGRRGRRAPAPPRGRRSLKSCPSVFAASTLSSTTSTRSGAPAPACGAGAGRAAADARSEAPAAASPPARSRAPALR